MGIETDLNVSPYFDDANNAIDDNYHRILFRPAVPVQARELTQMQDILQNQIERFGDHVFVAGTIIKGCNFTFDSNYNYAKIEDLRPLDSQPANPSQYVGLLAYEATSNLYAICYNYQDGFQSQDPDLKTLYFKYLNTGSNGESQFASGQQLEFYNTKEITGANTTTLVSNLNVTVASTANAVGSGYAMTVSEGVIFQKGHFIQVPNTVMTIVDKYSRAPDNVVAGFLIEEEIITELQDDNLYDQSAGYTNFNAPGAHRLKLNPVLTAFPANSAPSNNFLALVEWQNGNIIKSFQQTQYSSLGNELARRTYEESGDYFIKPFKIHTETANDTHNYVVTSAGLAYIDGHRVEQLNSVRTPFRKGTDIKTALNQVLNTNFNSSILVKEYSGNIPSNIGATVSLRQTPGTSITSRGYSSISSPGLEIGTAKVLAVEYDNGTVGTADATYRVYLTDIKMNTGKSFKDTKAIYYGGSIKGVADVVLTFEATSNSFVAMLSEPSKSTLVFPTAKSGLDGIASTGQLPDYVYRSVNTNIIINGTTGNSNILELTGSTVYPYGTGTLSAVQEREIVVIPIAFSNSSAQSANVTTATVGNVSIAVGNNTVIPAAGNTTAFTSEYLVGDYINISNQIRRIVTISNSSHMVVDSNWTANASSTHKKCYPLNVPINFADRSNYMTITDSDSQHLQISLARSNTVTTTSETLAVDMTTAVYYNAMIPNNSDRNLEANTNIVVNINTSNNAAGSNGPWCLGVPYAYNLKAVYKSSNTGTLIANTFSNTTVKCDTTGLSNGMAVFATNIPTGTTANVVNSTALVLSTNATTTATSVGIKYAYFSNNASDDVTQAFVIEDGQKDAFFDLSFLKKNPNYQFIGIGKDDLLTVVFDAFRPKNTGKGYISIDSYDTLIHTTGLIGYEDIPEYTSSSGRTYQLRDSIDFRPFVQATAAYSNTFTGAAVNPQYVSALPASENYVVAPNQTFKYAVDYFVGRIDKLMINSYGAYTVIEGVASENPIAPSDKVGSMTLATINIPPIPTLIAPATNANTSQQYVVTYTSKQNRGYTMGDIGKIDRRLDALEYYTSLSLLEQQTSSLTIVSEVTGANRFKNGIFVDNFSTLDSSDITNPEFKAALSDRETALVPRFVQSRIALKFANGVNVSKQGAAITLANTSQVKVINQKFATDPKSCTDAIYDYVGNGVLHPDYDDCPDIVTVKPTTPLPANTAPPPPPAVPPYTTGQLAIEVYDLGSSYYGILRYAYQAKNTGAAQRVFYGYTGTGNIPAGLVQVIGTNDAASRSQMNGWFGTNLQGRFVVFQYGYFIAPQTGTYTFRSTHDDDIQLIIDGQRVIYNNDVMTDNSTSNGTNPETGTINLVAGQMYNFYLAWYDNFGGITKLVMDFKVGSGAYQPLQPSYFARNNNNLVPILSLTNGTVLTTDTGYGALTYATKTPASITTSGYSVNTSLSAGISLTYPPSINVSSLPISTPIVTTNTQIIPVVYSTSSTGGGGGMNINFGLYRMNSK